MMFTTSLIQPKMQTSQISFTSDKKVRLSKQEKISSDKIKFDLDEFGTFFIKTLTELFQ